MAASPEAAHQVLDAASAAAQAAPHADPLLTALTVILAVALLLPFYRVLKGPTVFDRMLGVGVIGTKTVILICLVGHAYGRLDMFIDIAVAYAMLNFVGALVVAKYLDRTGGESR